MSNATDTTMAPTVHLNGTARAVLIEQNDDARAEVRAAIEAVEAAAPNARDYYPQGEGAYQRARAQHVARVRALAIVLAELSEIAEAIAE